MEEKLVIEVDKNNHKIGLRPISDFYNGKRIHRSSHLILFNSRNEILIQRRSLIHRLYPNLYTYSVSGFVDNESYKECIQRETIEELGISPSFKELFVYHFSDEYDSSFHAIFFSKDNQEIKIDEKEIESIKWISMKSLRRDMIEHKGKYTPPFLRGMEIFFSRYKSTPI